MQEGAYPGMQQQMGIPVPHSPYSQPKTFQQPRPQNNHHHSPIQDYGSSDGGDSETRRKIFVGGLDFKLSQEELSQHFSQFGRVSEAIILRDMNTQASRGFGFVSFEDEQVA